MADGWLDPSKYEHIPILGCTGPGSMEDGYAWKFVGHTTESPPGSLPGVISLFEGKPCYCPQFGYDPLSRSRVQFIPWTWAGAALRGGRSGWETNRGRAVQMEICDFAANSPNWSEETLWDVADIIADLIRDGCPIDPTVAPDYPSMSGTRAIEASPYRLSPQQWKDFPGIGAHIIVPFNDHYDWDHANADRIGALVQTNLGQAPGAAPDRPARAARNPAPASNMIAKGMEGGIVRFAQELLIGLGFACGPSGADGVFGPATQAAVAAFQRAHDLDADGIIGPMTQAAIAREYGNGPGIVANAPPWSGRYLLLQRPYLAGDDVRQWQDAVSSKGFPPGAIDGVYGGLTRMACVTFQKAQRLTADGVVGPITWNAAFA